MAVRKIDRLMDLRTIKRNIESGVLTSEQVREYLETLPDLSDKLEAMTIPDEDDDDDDYDDDIDDDDDDDVADEAPATTPEDTPAS